MTEYDYHWCWKQNTQNNTMQKVALVNSTTEKSRLRERGQTEPGLVAFYDIQPGNGAGLFLQPCSLHGASLCTMVVERERDR